MTTEGTQPDAPEGEPAATVEPEPEKDWKAEHDKLQRNARKWEDRAKANADAAKELEELKRQNLSDTEKAIAEATDRVRAETLAQVGGQLVAAEVRAAAAGRSVDADALLEAVDSSRFLSDDGSPDRDAITAWLDKVAPKPDPDATGGPSAPIDLGQGARGGQPLGLNSSQLERDLKAKLGIG